MFRRDKNKEERRDELDRLRRRVLAGDLGGEDDGVLSDDEKRWLEFERFLRIRSGLFNEDER